MSLINIKEIKSYNDFNLFKNDDDGNLKIVKVGAEWCGPCRILSDLIHNLDEEKVKGVLFSEINIEDDDMDEIATEYSIKNIPVLLFFKNGNMVNKTVGLINKDEIYSTIDKLR